ncbi:ryncolin-4-like [Stylophora pistillata]|nr:ryncolin-4-like [Stylophora pistillata]
MEMEDIDECISGSHDCHVNATCINTIGSHNCTCNEGFTGDGRICSAFQKNCAEIYKSGNTTDGVYNIKPDNVSTFDVFCDQTTDGGGWTVFQRRLDGSVDFYRKWYDYKQGFGNMNGEFWLGLDKIHRLTSNNYNILHVDLEDFDGHTRYAEYNMFGVMNENHKYKLILGDHSGTVPDSLSYHRDRPWSTRDQDNDERGNGSCAILFKGAWWYGRCHQSNLNGLYHDQPHSSQGAGVQWTNWKGYHYSLKRAEMKIRPEVFSPQ